MINPLKDKPLRLPGQSLDDNLIDLVFGAVMEYFIVIVIIVIFVIFEWLSFYFSLPPKPILLTIVGVIVILFCTYKIKKNMPKINDLKQGRDGERVVGQHLEELRSQGCKIFHDILGSSFNIDHVIVSPQGIFTVETKTWGKNNSKEVIRFDGNNLIVNNHSSKDVFIQSMAEANWLKNILKESTGREFKVQPIALFPGWFVDPESSKLAMSKGLWLLNPKALPEFIKNSPIILNNEDQNLIAFHLTRYVQTTP